MRMHLFEHLQNVPKIMVEDTTEEENDNDVEVESVIEDLLKKSFSSRVFADKMQIWMNGRPTPLLANLVTEKKHKCDRKSYTRHFMHSNYDKLEWITGCANLNKLFCWPCLLFSKVKNIWTKGGYADLNHFSISAQRHEKSNEHIHNVLKLKMFGKQTIDPLLDSAGHDSISRHNEKVRSNREILKRLIDAICFFAKQELPFKGLSENATPGNQINYIELLNFMRKYDELLDKHLEQDTEFCGTSTLLQNDLIECIADVLSNCIINEIKETKCVTIMLDEMSDIESKSQLSTVLRFVKDGLVHERFLGFTDISKDKTAKGVFQHVEKIITQYDLSNKLVGQTYDGASVRSDQLNALKTKVQNKYPHANFTHCYANVINSVLEQSLSNIKKCRLFIQTLSGLSSFFSKPSTINRLEEFIPSTRCNFTFRLYNTVKDYRTELIKFFENVIDESENWDNDTVINSIGFLSFLQDTKAIFLLEVFANIFPHTDVLYSILQSNQLDILHCCKKINDTKVALKDLRENGFEDIWKDTTILIRLQKGEDNPKRKKENSDSYRQLFIEIIDNVSGQFEDRFGTYENLIYFELLRPAKYSKYKANFPNKSLKKLQDMYETMFDYVKLRAELSVIYTSDEFKNKHVHEVIKFLNENGLKIAFNQVFKLCQLILCTPCVAGSVEKSSSMLKRIKMHCRSTQGQERLDSLSFLSIEKQLLFSLKSKPTFYDLIIETFVKKRRRMEITYL